MPIRILVTGGTFDKEYDEIEQKLVFRSSHVQDIIKRARGRVGIAVETIVLIDSLDMTDKHRRTIVEKCRSTPESLIVVTHGTDTMIQTATAIANANIMHKTIVLTGALIPYVFSGSDSLFNLGSAIAFVQILSPGVYIAMHGKYFPWDKVAKDQATGEFKEISD